MGRGELRLPTVLRKYSAVYDATPPTQLPVRRPVPTIIEQGAATPRTYVAARSTTQAPSSDRQNDDNTPVLLPLPKHNKQSLHRVRHHSHGQYMWPLQRRRCLQNHLRHQPAMLPRWDPKHQLVEPLLDSNEPYPIFRPINGDLVDQKPLLAGMRTMIWSDICIDRGIITPLPEGSSPLWRQHMYAICYMTINTIYRIETTFIQTRFRH